MLSVVEVFINDSYWTLGGDWPIVEFHKIRLSSALFSRA